MAYTVTGSNDAGAVSVQADTLEAAHQKAVEFENNGLKNVTIRDAQGQDVLDTGEEREFNETRGG